MCKQLNDLNEVTSDLADSGQQSLCSLYPVLRANENDSQTHASANARVGAHPSRNWRSPSASKPKKSVFSRG